MSRQRLDIALAARRPGLTRARARDLIDRGLVRVNGVVATKAGQLVDAADVVELLDERAATRVSRGAVKLAAALDHFGFSPAGRIALDVGASTGGFTQVLLERGAVRVHALDVGRGQLHASLKADPRVIEHSGVDARAIDRALIGADEIRALVCDVSFISLTKALAPALALAEPGCWLVVLVKPQFEAGREAVGGGGIVRDAAARDSAVDGVRGWLASQPGWQVAGVIPSPITGGDGNAEFLLGAIRES